MWNIILGICVTITATALAFEAFRLSRRDDYKFALICLMALCLILCLFTSTFLFLNGWDERFHALVASNLVHQPFKPMLIKEHDLWYSLANWTNNHIWLHKPPMALWGMALGIKLFGTNEIAIRIPSIILYTASVAATFYIAKYFFGMRGAFWAAFFHAINGFGAGIAGGRITNDAVDLYFMVFIAFAVATTIRFVETEKPKWNVLAGFLIGCALLTKWLPALIVLPVWLLLVYHSKKFTIGKAAKFFLLLMATAAIVALPWQFYIYAKFPQEAAIEAEYNFRHLFEALEGHAETWYYHLKMAVEMHGELFFLPVIWFAIKCFRPKIHFGKFAIFIWLAIPLIIFSIAKTRLEAYTFLTVPAVFTMFGGFVAAIETHSFFTEKKLLKILIIIALLYFPVKFTLTKHKFFEKVDRNPQWTQDLKALEHKINLEKAVIFNIEGNIEAMFYTGRPVYKRFPPNLKKVKEIQESGRTIYMFDNGQVPDSFANAAGIIMFK